MTKQNKKDDWEIVGELLYISMDIWPVLCIVIVPIALIYLIYRAIVWLINLFLSEKKNLPNIKSIKPESMHFHVISKNKIIRILCIDVLLILGLVYACVLKLTPLIALNTLYLLIVAVVVVTALLMITCDMHATISIDENNLYISYDYLFYKRKVRVIRLERIKKITIIDDKIKIITNFKPISLIANPDSEAFAYLLDLKQKLDV